MPDREKVIKGLECCGYSRFMDKCQECPYDGKDCFRRLKEDALALLQAQEPVEPVMDIDTWKCGKCGHTLEHQELLGDNVLFHEQYNYCPECGRAVKWE
jgi:hypothetical protein